jgi:glycosyltransferase involved in cell wall biosynthesis
MQIPIDNPRSAKPRTISIVANEFFDPAVGGMGGFGWIARETSLCLQGYDATLGTADDSVLFLTGNLAPAANTIDTRVHGRPLMFARPMDWPSYTADLRRKNIDVILSIDYRPTYDLPFSALPETPMIVWVQDPRPSDDIEKINTLRVPGSNVAPKGIEPIDCTSLAEVLTNSGRTEREVVFASPAPSLREKASRTFGLEVPPLEFLPYPLDFDCGEILKSPKPRVIFLGRLDPIKRPWIFVELAREFPNVEFLLLGQSHFHGPGAWQPANVPDNVRFVGHVGGEEKRALLASAWLLVNASIHEALPVSFLEALVFQLPIVSCQNPEEIVSRFGFYTGRFEGTGLDAIPSFREGLTRLLEDDNYRIRLGIAGQAWALENHGRRHFLKRFATMCERITEPPRQGARAGQSDRQLAIAEPIGTAKGHVLAHETARDITAAIPTGQPFILIDEDQLRSLFSPSAHPIPFLERSGEYWGPPADDETAIRELERLRHKGVSCVAIAWTAFWWLEHYVGFRAWLQSQQIAVTRTDSFMLLKLAKKESVAQNEMARL